MAGEEGYEGSNKAALLELSGALPMFASYALLPFRRTSNACSAGICRHIPFGIDREGWMCLFSLSYRSLGPCVRELACAIK